MRLLGKTLVKDDLHDFGYFTYFDRDGHKDHPSPLHHWQYGLILWTLSEYLSLINMFFPLDREIEKAHLKNRIEEIKRLKDNSKQRGSLSNRQNTLRGGWQVYP